MAGDQCRQIPAALGREFGRGACRRGHQDPFGLRLRTGEAGRSAWSFQSPDVADRQAGFAEQREFISGDDPDVRGRVAGVDLDAEERAGRIEHGGDHRRSDAGVGPPGREPLDPGPLLRGPFDAGSEVPQFGVRMQDEFATGERDQGARAGQRRRHPGERADLLERARTQ